MTINDKLPDEMIILIFSLLSEEVIAVNCSLVCKRWNRLCKEKSLISGVIRRILNGEDFTTIFEDMCFQRRYLSFDYIIQYVSDNYPKLGINGQNLWWGGLIKAVQSRDIKMVKRFERFGIPCSSDYYVRALYLSIDVNSLEMVKFFLEMVIFFVEGKHLYSGIVNTAKNRAEEQDKPEIVNYIESRYR